MHVCVYVYECMCVNACICAHVSVYICMSTCAMDCMQWEQGGQDSVGPPNTRLVLHASSLTIRQTNLHIDVIIATSVGDMTVDADAVIESDSKVVITKVIRMVIKMHKASSTNA